MTADYTFFGGKMGSMEPEEVLGRLKFKKT
jgi:hypothetical protein